VELGLQDKQVIVTGANRGTGAAIAAAFARAQAQVFVHRLDQEADDPTTDTLQREGYSVRAVWGDITSDEGLESLGEQLGDQADKFDILVNNFGMAVRGSWDRTTSEEWVDVYQKNVLSAVRMVHLMVDGMKARGWGRIVQLGTIGSFRPNARMPHYYSAKGAMATMTVSLAKELSGTGITVNTVSPGLIKTAEVEASFRALAQRKGWGDDWSEIARRAVEDMGGNLVGRMAETEEVADLVCFLASDRAGMINSENIRVDGGGLELPF